MKLAFKSRRGQFTEAFKTIEIPIARALTGMMDDAKSELIEGGRTVFRGAGFSQKWQNAWRGERYPKTGVSMEPAVYGFSRITYSDVFAEGAHLSGSPYLWLPLPWAPKKIGARVFNLRNYLALVGPLRSMRVPGKKPLLGAYMRGKPGQKPTIGRLHAGSALGRLGVRARRSDSGGQGVSLVPLFVGVRSATIGARIDMAPAARRVQGNMAGNYLRRLKAAR